MKHASIKDGVDACVMINSSGEATTYNLMDVLIVDNNICLRIR